MQHESATTRRRVMRWGGVVGAVGLAGCTGTTSESDEPAARDAEMTTAVDTDAPFRARLVDDESVLFTAAEIAAIGPISESERTGPAVPIELTEEGVRSVTDTAAEVGLQENDRAAEISLSLDGEEIRRFGVGESLAEAWANGEWNGPLVVTFDDREQAETVRDRLLADESA